MIRKQKKKHIRNPYTPYQLQLPGPSSPSTVPITQYLPPLPPQPLQLLCGPLGVPVPPGAARIRLPALRTLGHLGGEFELILIILYLNMFSSG